MPGNGRGSRAILTGPATRVAQGPDPALISFLAGPAILENIRFMAAMSPSEISRLQVCLRRLLGSPGLTVNAPPRAGLSVELAVNGEVVGTVHRDEDEGEVSYAVHMTVLEEDLPAPK